MELRPVVEADYPFLFDLATCEELGYRWRNQGETPSPEAFHHSVWSGVLAQFITSALGSEEPAGHVMIYRPDFRNGTAYIAQIVAPWVSGRGWSLEAGTLFIDYVFNLWNFRKLYGETLGFNYQQFASGTGSIFQEEGRLVDHEFYGGRYWDLHIVALYREDWGLCASKLGALRGGGPPLR